MTWATMMKTSAASVQSSLLEFSVASNLGKPAGPALTLTLTPLTPLSSSIPGVRPADMILLPQPQSGPLLRPRLRIQAGRSDLR